MRKRIVLALTLTFAAAMTASCNQQSSEVAALRQEVADVKAQLEKLGGGTRTTQPPVPVPGVILLDSPGMGGCKIDSKFPELTVTAPGKTVGWVVVNGCNIDATIEVFETAPKGGNSSPENSPFDGEVKKTIPKGRSGIITGRIKANLGQASGDERDGWTFKWRLNNAVQQDPELEVEY